MNGHVQGEGKSINVQARKAYREWTIATLINNLGKWSASRFGRFTPGERASFIHRKSEKSPDPTGNSTMIP